MHRRVIRISSGGVHNICIVEAKPSCILKEVYHAFKENKFTDVIFKGFYYTDTTTRTPGAEGGNYQSNESSERASDDEMKDDTFEEPQEANTS